MNKLWCISLMVYLIGCSNGQQPQTDNRPPEQKQEAAGDQHASSTENAAPTEVRPQAEQQQVLDEAPRHDAANQSRVDSVKLEKLKKKKR